MNKNDLRVVKTKQHIHFALTNLLKNKPLPRIKVTELCKLANINRGTFNFHYQDLGDVFKELFEEIMMDLRESYNAPYHHTAHLKEDYLYSYSSNAIIGLIIEWHRGDCQESADEMNIHLVNILKLY
ncbi:TetR-like C-terminal domain-containing protein [Terribacillus saccharophilus]|uniref:TetR-like C-terminal domain-containing protein n=1 Tax=Terribacillus saccharophilus TaxID=361277 RepID=UPI003981DD89